MVMVKDVKKLFISITIMIVFMIGTNLIYGDKALAQEGLKESQQVFINLSTDAKKNDFIYDADGRLNRSISLLGRIVMAKTIWSSLGLEESIKGTVHGK